MYTVSLTKKMNERLHELVSGGKRLVRVSKKCRILQLVGSGYSAAQAATAVGVCSNTARTTCRRFAQGGIDYAIYDKPRPGHQWLLTDSEEAKIAAMVCSSAPDGYSRWTIAIIAREAVRRKIVDHVSDATIGRLLHRHALKPWLEKNVVPTCAQ